MCEKPDKLDSVDLSEMTVEEIAIQRVLRGEVTGWTSMEQFMAEFGISETKENLEPGSTTRQNADPE